MDENDQHSKFISPEKGLKKKEKKKQIKVLRQKTGLPADENNLKEDFEQMCDNSNQHVEGSKNTPVIGLKKSNPPLPKCNSSLTHVRALTFEFNSPKDSVIRRIHTSPFSIRKTIDRKHIKSKSTPPKVSQTLFKTKVKKREELSCRTLKNSTKGKTELLGFEKGERDILSRPSKNWDTDLRKSLTDDPFIFSKRRVKFKDETASENRNEENFVAFREKTSTETRSGTCLINDTCDAVQGETKMGSSSYMTDDVIKSDGRSKNDIKPSSKESSVTKILTPQKQLKLLKDVNENENKTENEQEEQGKEISTIASEMTLQLRNCNKKMTIRKKCNIDNNTSKVIKFSKVKEISPSDISRDAKHKLILSPSKFHVNKRSLIDNINSNGFNFIDAQDPEVENVEINDNENNHQVTGDKPNFTEEPVNQESSNALTKCMPILETPMKCNQKMLSSLFSPTKMDDTPLTRSLKEQLQTGDINSIDTPKHLFTPNFTFTPSAMYKTPVPSIKSTDCSTSSSYYQPSDSDQKLLDFKIFASKQVEQLTTHTNQTEISNETVDLKESKCADKECSDDRTERQIEILGITNKLSAFNKNVIGQKNLKLLSKCSKQKCILPNQSNKNDSTNKCTSTAPSELIENSRYMLRSRSLRKVKMRVNDINIKCGRKATFSSREKLVNEKSPIIKPNSTKQSFKKNKTGIVERNCHKDLSSQKYKENDLNNKNNMGTKTGYRKYKQSRKRKKCLEMNGNYGQSSTSLKRKINQGTEDQVGLLETNHKNEINVSSPQGKSTDCNQATNSDCEAELLVKDLKERGIHLIHNKFLKNKNNSLRQDQKIKLIENEIDNTNLQINHKDISKEIVASDSQRCGNTLGIKNTDVEETQLPNCLETNISTEVFTLEKLESPVITTNLKLHENTLQNQKLIPKNMDLNFANQNNHGRANESSFFVSNTAEYNSGHISSFKERSIYNSDILGFTSKVFTDDSALICTHAEHSSINHHFDYCIKNFKTTGCVDCGEQAIQILKPSTFEFILEIPFNIDVMQTQSENLQILESSTLPLRETEEFLSRKLILNAENVLKESKLHKPVTQEVNSGNEEHNIIRRCKSGEIINNRSDGSLVTSRSKSADAINPRPSHLSQTDASNKKYIIDKSNLHTKCQRHSQSPRHVNTEKLEIFGLKNNEVINDNFHQKHTSSISIKCENVINRVRRKTSKLKNNSTDLFKISVLSTEDINNESIKFEENIITESKISSVRVTLNDPSKNNDESIDPEVCDTNENQKVPKICHPINR